MLSAIFEGSKRARVQVYRALDVLRTSKRSERQIVAFRRELVEASRLYGHAVDLTSFKEHLGQLDKALPWIVPPAAVADPHV